MSDEEMNERREELVAELTAALKDLLELVERGGDYLDGWQNSGQPVPKARAALARAGQAVPS